VGAALVLALIVLGWLSAPGRARRDREQCRPAAPPVPEAGPASRETARADAVHPGTVRGILEVIGGTEAEAPCEAVVSVDGTRDRTAAVPPGPFTLTYPRTDGDWAVSFSAPGFRAARYLLPEPDTDLGVVRLARGYTYGGIVLDDDDRPLSGVVVILGRGAGRSNETGADGRFTITPDKDVELSQSGGWAWPQELLVLDRGRYSQPIQGSDDGWRQAHVLHPVFAGAPLRLRFLTYATREPVVGLVAERLPELSASSRLPPPVHRAVTDEHGELDPDWPPWEMGGRWAITLPDGAPAWLSLARSALGLPVHEVLVGGPASVPLAVRVLRDGAPAAGTEIAVDGWWLTGGSHAGAPRFRIYGTVPDDGMLRWTLLVPSARSGTFELSGWRVGTKYAGPEDITQVPQGELPPIHLEGQSQPSNLVWIVIRSNAQVPPEPTVGGGVHAPGHAELIHDGKCLRGFPVYFTGDRMDAQDGGVAWLASLGGDAVNGSVPYDVLRLFLRMQGRRPQSFLFSRTEVREATAGRRSLECAIREWGGTAVLRVLRPDGQPCTGALATVSESGWDPGLQGHLWHVAAGADGIVKVADLAAGVAYAAGLHDPATGSAALVEDLHAGADQTVRLLGPEDVRFVVRDPEGAPVARARVRCQSVRAGLLPGRTCTADANGIVDLPGIVGPIYEVVVRVPAPGDRNSLSGTARLADVFARGSITVVPR